MDKRLTSRLNRSHAKGNSKDPTCHLLKKLEDKANYCKPTYLFKDKQVKSLSQQPEATQNVGSSKINHV